MWETSTGTECDIAVIGCGWVEEGWAEFLGD